MSNHIKIAVPPLPESEIIKMMRESLVTWQRECHHRDESIGALRREIVRWKDRNYALRDALESIRDRGIGRGAAACVTMETLRKIAAQALNTKEK